MTAAAGLDGCRGGWVVARRDAAGELRCVVIERLDHLAEVAPLPAVIGIDIPIGLPERGPRACDLEVRRVLGRRGASVFPAPVRAILGSEDYAEANARHRATDGRGVSRQTWNLVPKIREADALARRSPAWAARLHEVHPELSFALLAGGNALVEGKRSEGGRRLRCELLAAVFGAVAVERAVAGRDRGAAQTDDVLDALAVLWSAERLLRGEARCFGEGAGPDGAGLAMRIAA